MGKKCWGGGVGKNMGVDERQDMWGGGSNILSLFRPRQHFEWNSPYCFMS